MECMSLRKGDDYHKFVNSVVSVNLPLKTNVVCLGEISKVNDDSQGVDYVGKPTRVNDVSEEELIVCKSTRLKNYQLLGSKIFYGE
jgi:hypothetical protein